MGTRRILTKQLLALSSFSMFFLWDLFQYLYFIAIQILFNSILPSCFGCIHCYVYNVMVHNVMVHKVMVHIYKDAQLARTAFKNFGIRFVFVTSQKLVQKFCASFHQINPSSPDTADTTK